MHNKIDHFAIGADTLDQGVTAMEAKLGVTVPRGGKHDAMSTHNCVMQSGNESFFELIAIDPDAPADPGRVRWFSLDDPSTKARLTERPRALCWVVGTDDLDAVIAASPVDLGEVVLFTRGDRSWRLTQQTPRIVNASIKCLRSNAQAPSAMQINQPYIPHTARGGSVDLNRFWAFSKWFSAVVTPLPLRASAG
jgi:hypothetical protein